MSVLAAPAPAWRGGWREGLRYGGLGLPLAFVALPLYVLLPDHYGAGLRVPLAWFGVVLLGARLFDAWIDPWIGRRVDALFAHSTRRVFGAAAAFAALLALAFAALFDPPVAGAGRMEGAFVGWWYFATKLNLALAAGLALPALQVFGYAPGAHDASALQALTLAYCALPCALELAAAVLLHRLWIRHPDTPP